MARYTIKSAREDTSESLFVKNNATRYLGKPSEVLLPHTASGSKDTNSIRIPRSSNPTDLSMYAPKEDLLRNTQLLQLINTGMLELMSEDDALEILNSPEGIRETERIHAQKMRELANLGKPIRDFDGEVTTTAAKDFADAAKGDVDSRLVGVTPAIAQIMNDPTINDEIRASMLHNYNSDGLLTSRDKEYIRSNSDDPAIRKIAG